MSFNDRSFAWAQLAYVALVFTAALVWPGDGLWTTVGSLTGVWIAVSLLYQYTRAHNSAGWWTLLSATTVLAIGVIVNVWYFTTASGTTVMQPDLANPDARDYFYSALQTVTPGAASPVHTKLTLYRHFARIWDITGISIFPLIVSNMVMILASVVVSGVVTERLLRGLTDRSPQWLTTCAMIMTAGVCYYLNSGTVLLKDASVALGMTMCALTITGIPRPFADRTVRALAVGCFTVGILLLAMARFQYIYIVAVGILIMAMATSTRRRLTYTAILISLCAVAWILVRVYVSTETAPEDIINDSLVGTYAEHGYFFGHSPGHEAYEEYVDNDYFYWPQWRKLLWLPVSAVTQYLIPFPWNYTRDTIFGPTLAYAHFAYPWYALGSLILYFIGACMRRVPRMLVAWTLWAVLAWLVPAYSVAGTVSRYGLSFIPMLVPAAVYVAATCTQRRSWRVWTGVYVVLLAATLIICHHIQAAA
ncbi:MAG: hypothetical protein NC117_08990 [Pseudoflavonifractor sp.]|nr:hypothetical protein [Pseudoflavonifractor sp.]